MAADNGWTGGKVLLHRGVHRGPPPSARPPRCLHSQVRLHIRMFYFVWLVISVSCSSQIEQSDVPEWEVRCPWVSIAPPVSRHHDGTARWSGSSPGARAGCRLCPWFSSHRGVASLVTWMWTSVAVSAGVRVWSRWGGPGTAENLHHCKIGLD